MKTYKVKYELTDGTRGYMIIDDVESREEARQEFWKEAKAEDMNVVGAIRIVRHIQR